MEKGKTRERERKRGKEGGGEKDKHLDADGEDHMKSGSETQVADRVENRDRFDLSRLAGLGSAAE